MLQHLRGHLDPVGTGDLEVQHDHLRPRGGEPGQCLVAVGGHGHDVEPGRLEVTLHGVTPHRVVVDHHHPDRLLLLRHGADPNRSQRPRR